jgi:hypothetical protein
MPGQWDGKPSISHCLVVLPMGNMIGRRRSRPSLMSAKVLLFTQLCFEAAPPSAGHKNHAEYA